MQCPNCYRNVIKTSNWDGNIDNYDWSQEKGTILKRTSIATWTDYVIVDDNFLQKTSTRDVKASIVYISLQLDSENIQGPLDEVSDKAVPIKLTCMACGYQMFPQEVGLAPWKDLEKDDLGYILQQIETENTISTIRYKSDIYSQYKVRHQKSSRKSKTISRYIYPKEEYPEYLISDDDISTLKLLLGRNDMGEIKNFLEVNYPKVTDINDLVKWLKDR
jgi:hypothetical protein